MASEFPYFKPQTAIVHSYGYNLSAVEFTETPQKLNANVVVLIAGLNNGLNAIPYIPELAAKLASQNWSLVQIIFQSSYLGYGTSSLKQDTEDISKLVKYLRSEVGGSRQKVVLLGHSTGCQDSLEYLSKKWYEPGFDAPVEGAILQAPVSDVEAFGGDSDGKVTKLVDEVRADYISQGKESHLLPEKFRQFLYNTPITAYRFNSLFSPRGDDDYFSSYLTEEDHAKSFGKVKVPLAIAFSGSDEFVPKKIDQQKLVDSWKKSTDPKFWSPVGGIVKGAKHNIGKESDEGALEDFINLVSKFVTTV